MREQKKKEKNEAQPKKRGRKPKQVGEAKTPCQKRKFKSKLRQQKHPSNLIQVINVMRKLLGLRPVEVPRAAV